MLTEPYYACLVETSDVILHDGTAWEVTSINDSEDFIVFNVTDGEGSGDTLSFEPFETVYVVTAFEE